MPVAAGYLMSAGHFQLKSRIERRFESSPESRGSQTSGVLLVLFVQAKRIKPFPFRKARGSANLDSARRNGGFALTKLKPFSKKASRFCKPRISAPKPKLRTNPIKSFAAPRLLPAASPLLFPPYGGVPAGTARSVCFFATCGGFFGGLAAFVTFLSESCPFRDGTLRVRFRRSAAALQGTGKPTPCILAASRLYSAVKPPNNC